MSDLISREAAISTAQTMYERCDTGDLIDYREMMVESLKVLPAAQPERIRGRWIREGHIEHTWLVSKCSVCGGQTIDAGTYCTNCGAEMEVSK